MGPLAAVERFLERLFERQSARLFRTGIRPVVILRRLERVMEDGRVRDGGRTIVPHRLVVRLHPEDLAALRAAAPDLAEVLADGALAFARHHGYTILDRPTVTIRPDARVDRTDVAVEVAAGHPRAAATDEPPGDPDPGQPAEAAADAGDSDAGGRPSDVAEARASPPPAADQTAVFVVPVADGPVATIREIRPDASGRTVRFDGRPMTIGRATDNSLVLRDGRASRHHARIDARRGTLVLSDLGSTNGSWVNDRRVESMALGEGDRIRIGATTLLVEAIETDPSAGSAGRTDDAIGR
jgi:FHA domain-containing protein